MEVQIFLASSILEFEIDRLKIVDFVNILNKIYHKEKSDLDYDESRDLFFRLNKSGDNGDSMERGAKQDLYDKQILESDFVYFLFGEKVGVVTKHEFDLAYVAFKKVAKPKIFIYARITTDDGKPILMDTSAKNFDTLLRNDIKHYYGKYQHIDTLLYKMAMNIIAMNYPIMNVNLKDDSIVDGIEPILSLKNVPAWNANDALLQAQEELDKIQRKYLDLQTQWNKEEHDKTVDVEYAAIVDEYEKKREDLKKLQITIFNDLCGATRALLSGNLTDNQAHAYQLMEQGKWKEADIILDFEGIKRDIQHLHDLKKTNTAIKQQTAENDAKIRCEAKNKLDDLMLKIRIASSLSKNAEDYKKISSYYAEAINVSKVFNLSKEVMIKYAKHLTELSQQKSAIEILKEFTACVEEETDLLHKAEATILLVELSNELAEEPEKVFGYFCDAINIWKKILDTKETTIHEQDGRNYLLHFHQFLQQIGLFIDGNKNYKGEERGENNSKFGSFTRHYQTLHELCEKIMKQNNILLSFSDSFPISYVTRVKRVILLSESRPSKLKEKEAKLSDEEIVENMKTNWTKYFAEKHLDNQLETLHATEKLTTDSYVKAMRRDIEHNIVETATTPREQAEQLFIYSYQISNCILSNFVTDEWLIRHAVICNVLGEMHLHNSKVAKAFFDDALQSYEQVCDKERLSPLAIPMLYMDMARELFISDSKAKSNKNEKDVLAFQQVALNQVETLYGSNQMLYYTEIIKYYFDNAECLEYYGEINKNNEHLIAADEALVKIVIISIKFGNIEWSANTAAIMARAMKTLLMLRFRYCSDLNKKIRLIENYRQYLSLCKKYVKKYPKTFLLEKFLCHMTGVSFFASIQKKDALEQLTDAVNIALIMAKNDDATQFYAWNALFHTYFSKESYEKGKIEKIPEQLLDAVLEIEKNSLQKLLNIFLNEISTSIRLIPYRERFSRVEIQINEQEHKFLQDFESIFYRATKELNRIFIEEKQINELQQLLSKLIKKYIYLGHNRVVGQTSGFTKNVHILEENTISQRLCISEAKNLAKLLEQIDAEEICECTIYSEYIEESLNFNAENVKNQNMTEEAADKIAEISRNLLGIFQRDVDVILKALANGSMRTVDEKKIIIVDKAVKAHEALSERFPDIFNKLLSACYFFEHMFTLSRMTGSSTPSEVSNKYVKSLYNMLTLKRKLELYDNELKLVIKILGSSTYFKDIEITDTKQLEFALDTFIEHLGKTFV